MEVYEAHGRDIYSHTGQVVATAADLDNAQRIALTLTACAGISRESLGQMEPGELNEAYRFSLDQAVVFGPADPEASIGSEGVR